VTAVGVLRCARCCVSGPLHWRMSFEKIEDVEFVEFVEDVEFVGLTPRFSA
jgi:hypothetical protein